MGGDDQTDQDTPTAGDPPATRVDTILFWIVRVVAAIGVLVAVVAALRTGAMLVHGHPAYLILLIVVFAVSAVIAVRAWMTRRPLHRRFTVLRVILIAGSVAVLGAAWWLVPYSAVEPAVAAMESDSNVTVTETATDIMIAPAGAESGVGVFFQPGALVDARAYAAVLRPLAEQGHAVVIAKQPFSIAFLALGAFSGARGAHPEITEWVVGGHSLGGVVAAMDAASYDSAADDPVVGLMLYASYPATDMSDLAAKVLSISASEDGLATPAKIDASRSTLPAATVYVVIEGGVHAFFGDYGPQPGDGAPTISHDQARTEISDASVAFVNGLTR